MNVLITGSSGMVGAALAASLIAAGHRVSRLVRSPSQIKTGDIYWKPEAKQLDFAALEGTDAVVHLAGETISDGWTDQKKLRIVQSRLQSTRLLSESLGRLKQPPKVLVSASAIGYYGDRGSEVLLEESPAGSGFLPELCHLWEAAAALTAEHGVRVVRLRIGIVLSDRGGALAKMLPPFRMGFAGIMGSGKQYMSWIALEDLVGVILHAINSPELQGAVNAVAPAPVTNEVFTRALAEALWGSPPPPVFTIPGFAVRLAFGEMGKELLLASTRVEPSKLKKSGYVFVYPELEAALQHLVGRASLTKTR